MKVQSRLLALLFILSLGLSGCVTVQSEVMQPEDTPNLEPSVMVKFSDVPTPTGFRLLSEKSFVLESGGVRAGVLRYVGKANLESITAFYKNQMQMYNWALLNVLEYGDRMLNFERENESCVVTVEPKGSKIEIAVSLAPKSPIAVSVRKIETETVKSTKQTK